MKNFTRFFALLFGMLLCSQFASGQTLLDSFGDGNFTASPVWGGNTTLWTIAASDAAAGAAGSNTLRMNASTSGNSYLSTQVATFASSQEWGFFVGRRAQAYTAANQVYIWLYANEANLTNATVDGYRIAIGDDTGGDDIRLEYIVNGAVSATVITSSGSLTSGVTDIGFLLRVTRSSAGAWQIFTSTLPTSAGTGAIATAIPNSTNATVNQGTGSNSSLSPAANGYIGIATLHSGGASAIVANELDQVYFTATAGAGPEINVKGNSTDIVSGDVTPATGDDTDFGSVALGGTIAKTFTIHNTGTTDLVLGSPAVTLSNNSNDFSITALPSSPVAASGSTTFQITFNPTSGGTQTNTVNIASDDTDEGTYTFAIAAAATIGTPTATAATNQLATQFDANWNAVTGVSSYALDVATTSTFTSTNTVISDDFEAGTLTNWQNTTNWTNSNNTPITGTRSLRVNAPAAQTTSTIYTQPSSYDVTTGTTTWRFNFKTGYAPSGNNRAHFFLMSNSTTFATANGYAVGFNFSGSDDLIKLCKSTGGTASTLVASAQAVASGVTYGVEVIRTKDGVWTLKTKSGGGFASMTTAGSISDTSFTATTYSGLVALTSSSNNLNFRFDDFSIQSEISTCLPSYNDLNVGNVTTYPVTGLSTNTTYYYRVRAVNGITSANSNTITVTPVSVGGTVAPSNQTICSGTQPANLVLSGHVGNVIRWEKASDGAFTTPVTIVSTATTFTGAVIGNLTASTFFRAVVQNGAGSPVNSSTATVSVDPAAVGGTVNGATTVCSATNSGSLTLSGNTGSVVRWESSTNNFATAGTNIANTTTTLNYTNVAVTTYYRVYVQSGGCFAYSTVAAISVGNSSTTWDGGSWSNGDPDIGKAAVITGDYQTSDDMSACSITVSNGATFTISNGSDVTVNNNVTVDSGSNLVIQNNGNLIQLTSAANSGEIHVFRASSAIQRLDYTLWSSPVAGQNLLDFSPLTIATRFYTYNTTTNQYNTVTPSTNDFTIGKGYLIRMPDDHPATPTNWFGEFIGVPHNGDVNVTMVNGGSGQRFNLIGNPYPCTVNMNEFVDDNSSNITGTLYFWRKTNNAASPSYCTWSQGGFVNNGEAEAYDPLGVLQTGQGFLVEAAGAATTVQFNNSQRIGNNDGQFFRSANIAEKNRIWLNATNEAGAYSQMLVGYMTDATSGVDYGIDGKYINDGPIALNSIIDATDYAIQGRALPFEVTDVVPLRFKATTAGNYSIAIDHTDGFFTGTDAQDVFLRDNSNGVVHDLNDSAYTFASDAGTFASRFELIFENQLSVNNPDFNANNVVVYSQNGSIVINSGSIIMDEVKVFDIRGRLIAEKSGVNASEATINGGNANQVLVVKITSDAKQTVTKKVVN